MKGKDVSVYAVMEVPSGTRFGGIVAGDRAVSSHHFQRRPNGAWSQAEVGIVLVLRSPNTRQVRLGRRGGLCPRRIAPGLGQGRYFGEVVASTLTCGCRCSRSVWDSRSLSLSA